MPDGSTGGGNGGGKGGLFARLSGLSNDSTAKTLVVAITLCLVCSIIVSSAAVFLRPTQERNAEQARRAQILVVAGLWQEGADVDALFAQVDARIVNLATGAFDDAIDPATFDESAAARDPATRVAIPAADDIAKLSTRASVAPVYLVRDGEVIETIVLPVRGYGLWSTMRGFLALEGDGNTVRGLTFYDHAETPGLGGEIENPRWLGQWPGRRVFDDSGAVALRVVKGQVDPASSAAAYQVDGLSGATLTSNGVTNMIQYWMGEEGFGPFLARIRTEGSLGASP